MREIKTRPDINNTDYEFKLGHAAKFLSNGDELKITVMFRGREVTHPEIGERVLLRFAKDLEEYGKAELPPMQNGNQMFLNFMPGRYPAGFSR